MHMQNDNSGRQCFAAELVSGIKLHEKALVTHGAYVLQLP